MSLINLAKKMDAAWNKVMDAEEEFGIAWDEADEEERMSLLRHHRIRLSPFSPGIMTIDDVYVIKYLKHNT